MARSPSRFRHSASLQRYRETPAEIATSEGVQLFIERARAVRPNFSLTEQNATAIAEIVRRLDGIPLALELAAARLRMLTVEQIAARLNDRFRLLTGGRRTALPRQQTLQALIEWSWQLLDEQERVLLRRLSVFSGGWTIEAAQAITGFTPLDEFEVFNFLEQLINKSLVIVRDLPEGEAHYNMLESIHQFAQDKLFEAVEGETLRDRHVDYYVALVDQFMHSGLELGELGYFALVLSVALVLGAIWLARRFYIQKPEGATHLRVNLAPVHTTLLNKYYVDELYGAVIVRPVVAFSVFLWKIVDVLIIDGMINGLAILWSDFSNGLRHAQSGRLRNYATVFVAGVVLLIFYVVMEAGSGR